MREQRGHGGANPPHVRVERESGARAPGGPEPGIGGGALRNVVVRGRELVQTNRGVLAAAMATLLAGVIVAAVMEGASGSVLRGGGVCIGLGVLVLALSADRSDAVDVLHPQRGLVFGRERKRAHAVLVRCVLSALALAAAWTVALVAVVRIPDLVNPPPPVGQAVGVGAFLGLPYRGAQIGAVVSVAAATLLALAAVVVPRLAPLRAVPQDRPPTRKAPASTVHIERPSSRSVAIWVGVAVLGFTLVPDLRDYVRHEGDNQICWVQCWDIANFITWKEFVSMGFLPMKDFFYPYGFQWLYGLPSFGPLFQWLVQFAGLALAGWSLWRLSGGQRWRVLACLLALLLVGSSPEAWRYIPALLVPLTYAALGPARHSRLERGHAVFFAACLLAVLVEPDLLGIGLVGALLVLAGEVVGERLTWRPRRLALALALDAVPVLGSVLLILPVWLATGTATANLRFFSGLTAVSAAAAQGWQVPGSVRSLVLHPHTFSLYAALPALLAAAGFLWARLQRHDRSGIDAILLSASGVSLVLLLKHVVRPIDDLMLIVPVIALSWGVILAWRQDSIVRAAACGAALGALLTIVAQTGGQSLSQYVSSAVASPVHAVRSVLVAFDRGARVRAARAGLAPARFTAWGDSAIAAEYKETVHAPPLPPFAIVGDAQLTYVLLRQRPPFHTQLYDASPLAEQQAMVAVLARRRPPYVIWHRASDVDGMLLYHVRDPVVFAWMIENYIPVRTFPTVDILRRRRPGEAIPASFWHSHLGATVDLGSIPSFSGAAGSPSCSGGPGCVPYALLHAGTTGGNAMASFDVAGGGATYRVTLRSRAGVEDYPVRLDRLWFWPLVGASPTITSLTPGFTVRLKGLRSGDNLY